jgi:hypothetical protein
MCGVAIIAPTIDAAEDQPSAHNSVWTRMSVPLRLPGGEQLVCSEGCVHSDVCPPRAREFAGDAQSVVIHLA